MITRRRVSLLFVIVLSSIILITLFSLMTHLHPGIGFGRDVQIIVDISANPSQFTDFSYGQRYLGREVFVHNIGETHRLLTVSGVTDIQIFATEMETVMKDLTINSVGSFGSTATVSQFMQSFMLYIVVFSLSALIFWTIRFGAVGYTVMLISIVELLGAFVILAVLGNPMTYLVWFTMLTCFALMAFQKRQLIYYLIRPTFNAEPEKDLKFCIKFGLQSLLTLIYSAILYYSGFLLTSAARYLVAISILLLLESLLMPFVLTILRNYRNKYPTTLFNLKIRRISRSVRDTDVKGWSRIIIGVMVTSALTGILFNIIQNRNTEATSEFTRKVLYVIEKDDPRSFVEMQASFAANDVLENQMSYRISEQGATWIGFDKAVKLDSLARADVEISEKLGVQGTLYDYNGPKDPFMSSTFYIVLGVYLMIAAFISFISGNRVLSRLTVVFAIATIVLYLLWFELFSMQPSRLSMLLILMTPLVISNFVISTPRELSEYSQKERLVYAARDNIVLVMITCLPILLMVVSPASEVISIVSSIYIWSLSSILATLVYPLVVRGKLYD